MKEILKRLGVAAVVLILTGLTLMVLPIIGLFAAVVIVLFAIFMIVVIFNPSTKVTFNVVRKS